MTQAQSAATLNYAQIIQAVHDVAVTASFQAAPKDTKIGMLPFPLELTTAGFPYLAVRFGVWAGYRNLPTLATASADQYARLQGGLGRIGSWDFGVVMLYGYKPDASSVATAATAAADLMALEQIFQLNEDLSGTCIKANPHSLWLGTLSQLTQPIAGQQVFVATLSVRAYTNATVTY